jgi:prolyl-tRNA synthetase
MAEAVWPEVHGCGDRRAKHRVREESKATCRAIPLDQQGASGPCIVCGKEGDRAFFAKAY